MIRVVFGTRGDCDVVLTSEHASPRHFDIRERADGSVVCRDLGSTNGTRVSSRVGWQSAFPSEIPVGKGSMIVAGRMVIEITMNGRVTVRGPLATAELIRLMMRA